MFHCDDPDYNFIGIDADGLESRVEAHYCYPFKGGKEYAYELLDGDVHQNLADKIGIDRKTAKSVKYGVTKIHWSL